MTRHVHKVRDVLSASQHMLPCATRDDRVPVMHLHDALGRDLHFADSLHQVILVRRYLVVELCKHVNDINESLSENVDQRNALRRTFTGLVDPSHNFFPTVGVALPYLFTALTAASFVFRTLSRISCCVTCP